jgi:hypothetical protein
MSGDDLSGGEGSSEDGPSLPPLRIHPPRLTDVEAYGHLVRLGHLTHRLSARCWSTAAATALAAAAHTLRALASALYRANIRDHTDRGDPS